MLTRDLAFVLAIKPYREGHLLVVLLSKRHGLIRAVAHKAQQAKSLLHSTCQPFVEADFLLRLSDNGLADILQAETLDAHSALRMDMVKAGFAAACSEWLMQAAGQDGLARPATAYACYQDGLRGLARMEVPALTYLRFLFCTLHEAGLALNAAEMASWRLSPAAQRLLAGVVASEASTTVSGNARDATNELLDAVSSWVFDQTGIVLKSLKIAIQLALGSEG